jgi:hypothetical protein
LSHDPFSSFFLCSGLQVDKGFVAQVADVMGGREAPVNEEQRQEGEKTVPEEFSKVKHVRGILSMGRYNLISLNRLSKLVLSNV